MSFFFLEMFFSSLIFHASCFPEFLSTFFLPSNPIVSYSRDCLQWLKVTKLEFLLRLPSTSKIFMNSPVKNIQFSSRNNHTLPLFWYKIKSVAIWVTPSNNWTGSIQQRPKHWYCQVWNAMMFCPFMHENWLNPQLRPQSLFSHPLLYFKRLLIICSGSVRIPISQQFLPNYVRWGRMRNDRWVIRVIPEMGGKSFPPTAQTPTNNKAHHLDHISCLSRYFAREKFKIWIYICSGTKTIIKLNTLVRKLGFSHTKTWANNEEMNILIPKTSPFVHLSYAEKSSLSPKVIFLPDTYPGTGSTGGRHLQESREWQGQHLSTGAHD